MKFLIHEPYIENPPGTQHILPFTIFHMTLVSYVFWGK